MKLFDRTSPDPHAWTALWGALEPSGGRSGSRLRRRAVRQLIAAYGLLDTEEHASHVSGHPWRGPDQPFARGRFQRAIDAVVFAGPEAVAQVAAEPRLITLYDDQLALERGDARLNILPGDQFFVHLFGSSARRVPASVCSPGLVERLTSWPTWYWIPGGRAPFDPEHFFVHIEQDDDDRWQSAKDGAVEALERAIGGRAARREDLSLVFLHVSADRNVSARRETGMLIHDGDFAEFDSGDVTVIVDVDPAAPGTVETLAATLTVRAARLLLSCPAPWADTQRDGLRSLVESAPAP